MLLLTALLAPLLGSPQSAELLPPTPQGENGAWRYERIDFPLEFAPDIEWDGFEELSFAPGMFTEGAPDYWSYALALKVKPKAGGALKLDAEAIDAFLESYYRGLLVAVGEGRQQVVDPASIQAEVRGGGAQYTATVEIVDTFVTGEPATLTFELLVHPDPGGGEWTELFGMASPAAADAEVWKQLRVMGAAWRAARPVPVFLNHVYIVPDLATYEALRDSEFLRELAVVEERTTERADRSYTGLYVYGETTYFEFLRPDPNSGFAPGASGIAFGVEAPGDIARVAEVLKAEGVQTFAGPMTRGFEGEQLPWFDILGIQAATTTQRLQLFAMEYDTGFLEQWNAEDDGAAGRIDRSAVLARYASVLGQPTAPRFADIAWVSCQLHPDEFARYRQVTRAFGFEAEELAHHTGQLDRGPKPVEYVVGAESKGPGGVHGLGLRLAGAIDLPQPLELGLIEVRKDRNGFLLFDFSSLYKETK